MGRFIEVGTSGDLAEGTMKEVIVEGQRVLLAKIGDSYYAAEDRCPHLGARLSGGKLEGSVVTCPRHGSQFDLKDGRVIRWTDMPPVIAMIGKIIKRPRPVITYAVRVDGDRVLVEM